MRIVLYIDFWKYVKEKKILFFKTDLIFLCDFYYYVYYEDIKRMY